MESAPATSTRSRIFWKCQNVDKQFLSDISEKQKSENSVEKIYIFRIEYFMHVNSTVTFVTDHIWQDHLLIINVNFMVFLLCSGGVPSLFWVLKTLDFNLKLVVARTNKFTLQLIGLLIEPMGVYAWPDLTEQHKKRTTFTSTGSGILGLKHEKKS